MDSFNYSSFSTDINAKSGNNVSNSSTTSNNIGGITYKCLTCGELCSFKLKDIIRCKKCGKCLFVKCRNPKASSTFVAI
jgi:DNA-directed RNA polymerase subunit RPC12/RpoP